MTDEKTETGDSSVPVTTHTPGPWVIRDDTRIYAHPFCIAEAWGGLDGEVTVGPTTLANARLIAAAPDLLVALKVASDTIHIWHGDIAWGEYQQSPEMKRINAAIAKATE